MRSRKSNQALSIMFRRVQKKAEVEGWRKRKYSAVFKNKITDSMQEASETQCWLEFSLACKYIDETVFKELDDEYEEIILMLNSMEKNSEKFCY